MGSVSARSLARTRIWNGKWGEERTYDGVKEKVGVMRIADANSTRSGLLRSHGCGEVEGAMVGVEAKGVGSGIGTGGDRMRESASKEAQTDGTQMALSKLSRRGND